MKKSFKVFSITLLALLLSIGGVDAESATKKIDTSACETVYTNYYFFLDANTTDFFANSPLSEITHTTIAEYTNNSYLTSNFDSSNVGYGQVGITRNTTTSSDGLKYMSLDDYYTIYLKAGKLGGAYTEGTKNYIVSHSWYSVSSNGTETKKDNGLDLSNQSKSNLIAATLDANSVFTLRSSISSYAANPFRIQINRTYTGYLTGTPITVGNYEWYIHPAVYYIQYCSPIESKYSIIYDGNAKDATDVPDAVTVDADECTRISTVTPKRSGYEFLGWSLKSNAIAPDENFTPGSKYCGTEGDIILYAVWKKIEEVVPAPIETYYYVFYKTNTTDVVTNMPQDAVINTDNDVFIASNIPVRDGYTFQGWSTDATSTVGDPNYNGGSLYVDRKDLTLYAIWKKNPILPENPQTGITDYLLPFGGVISASGVGLGILKKKKLFRQF